MGGKLRTAKFFWGLKKKKVRGKMMLSVLPNIHHVGKQSIQNSRKLRDGNLRMWSNAELQI